MTLAGNGRFGLLVESHEGRPTKVEGNPDHPASLGATDLYSQASVLGLYDPDRSQTPIRNAANPRGWDEPRRSCEGAFREPLKQGGKGVRILTDAVASPTLAAMLDRLTDPLPQAQWIEYEPARLDPDVDGARIAFEKPLQVRYDFVRADVIVSLDADFLSCGGGQLWHVRDFTSRRRVGDGDAPMNRLYAVEASPTNTGMIADHRLTLKAAQVETFARLLARELKVDEVPATGELPEPVGQWVKAVAADLTAKQPDGKRTRSIVVAGAGQPPAVHALAYAINARLENIGETVLFASPAPSKARQSLAALKELADELDRGEVEMLLVLSGNPVYAAPVDLAFGERIGKAKTSVHLGLYQDETARKAPNGTSPRHIFSKPGATAAPSTATRRSLPAADRAAVPRQVGPGIAVRPGRRVAANRPRPGARALAARRAGRRRLRTLLAAGAERRRRPQYGRRCGGRRRRRRAGRSGPGWRRRPRPRPSRKNLMRSSSVSIRRCSTAVSPTTAGCRSCPSR